MPSPGGMSKSEAQRKVVDALTMGLSVKDACAAVSRSVKSYENWRSVDKDFARACDEARERRKRALDAGKDADVYQLDFASWRKRFLGRETYDHQRQWIDVLEGREPADLHPSIQYEPGRPDRVLLNTPPFHAKSATITRDYVAYRLCMNPNYRVIIVSKTQQQAKKFLYAIRQLLTSSVYAELQAAYAPEGGFKGGREDGAWTSNMIYLSGRDSAEKDPSLEALGIGGQIYGARADLIVLDDAVTLGNANDHEKQMTWINQEVSSRLKGGKLLVVGTRVATTDLYSELRNGDNYLSGKSPWTYLGQPCVLEYADEPADWVTLWPKSSEALDENAEPGEDGLYDAWSGPSLHDVREAVKPATWALIYMQQAIADDATFHPTCVWGSVDKRRKPGPLRPGEWGGRREGMQGLHVIGSVDPAGTGEAFVLALAVDRATGERWVLNGWMHSGASNLTWYLEMVGTLYDEYGITDLVVESNAYSSWLIHDDRIVDYCRNRGIKISPHYTGNNKADPDFGVASIAPLFGTLKRHVEGGRPDFVSGSNLIHLPDPGHSPAVKALVEQLLTWQPGKQGRQLRQDGPMALWFAELRARTVVNGNRGHQDFMENKYLSRKAQSRRFITPLHVVA
jgi:hypothetical protein